MTAPIVSPARNAQTTPVRRAAPPIPTTRLVKVELRKMFDTRGGQWLFVLTGGLIVAEAVMMAAAPKLGRGRAHDVVYDACRAAIASGRGLAEALGEVPEVVEALGGREAVERRCDPANYLGLAPEMVDRILGGRGAA